MKYIIEKLEQQKAVVEGEEVTIDGEVFVLGALTEEEKEEMIKEGKDLANKTFNIDGKKTKLIDIESGKRLFEITDVLNLEGNFTGLWYVWRAKTIMNAFKKKSEKAQADLTKVLATKGLDIYLEEL